VPPLAPCFEAKRIDPSPHAADRSLFKSFLQSFRSDFQRQRWEAPTARQVLAERKPQGGAGPSTSTSTSARPGSPAARYDRQGRGDHAAGLRPDRGLAFTDYLLGKQRDNGGLQEAYETTCIELERKVAGRTERVDVYEMYWADLSRLSGAIPRILTEFGTLIFRLSRLGRDTVDEGRGFLRGQGGAPLVWKALTFLQTTLDWLFVNVLAQLFFHLLLFGTALSSSAWRVRSSRSTGCISAYRAGAAGVLLSSIDAAARRDRSLAATMLAMAAVSLFVTGAEVAITGLVPSPRQCRLRRGAARRRRALSFVAPSVWQSGPCCSPCAGAPLRRPRRRRRHADAWRGAALYGTELTLAAIEGSGSDSRRCCCSGFAGLLAQLATSSGRPRRQRRPRGGTIWRAPASPPAGSASASRSAPSSS
jgi:hypothetical protein